MNIYENKLIITTRDRHKTESLRRGQIISFLLRSLCKSCARATLAFLFGALVAPTQIKDNYKHLRVRSKNKISKFSPQNTIIAFLVNIYVRCVSQ